MPQSLSSSNGMPLEWHRGPVTSTYTNADGKRIEFQRHKSYWDCECWLDDLDLFETHHVAEEAGNATRHRIDCYAHPIPFLPSKERERSRQIRRQKAEQKRRRKQVSAARKMEEVEITARPVYDPRKDCLCDLLEEYEKQLFRLGESSLSKYAAERRRIKDDQIRMLSGPCPAHVLCCAKCHYALQDLDRREPQVVRADDSKTDFNMIRANGMTSTGHNFTDASPKPFRPLGYSSVKHSARSISAAAAKNTSKRLKRLANPGVKQTVQLDYEMLARDILRAAGIHPYLRSLNAHLDNPKHPNVGHYVADNDPRSKRARRR